MNTENNRLLAEFMGYKHNPETEEYFETFIKDGVSEYRVDLLQFHSDWNWLMEVVEKIESIKGTQIFINGISCEIMFKGKVISKHFNTKIEAVYMAVVEFIKWYNQQK